MPSTHESSFRDPSGFIFTEGGGLFRQINRSYKVHYDALLSSGLFEALVAENLLVAHEEADVSPPSPSEAYKIIRPEVIPFISYPYEWSFSELRDAGLTTLRIQKKALEFGMSLKDSSAFNIQFFRGRPVLIDTLSFETYTPGKPWVAYRQFCQHFLAPLVLMAYRDPRLGLLFRSFLDGIPLDLAAGLLPRRHLLRGPLLLHLHLHAKSQKRHARPVRLQNSRLESSFSLRAFQGLIDSLESALVKLRIPAEKGQWGGYDSCESYSRDAIRHKEEVVSEWLDRIRPESVWDLGANKGSFSRVAASKGAHVVSFDMDHACVEENYLTVKKKGETNLLPLVLDLFNPSPGLGWAHAERHSLLHRAPAETVLALALIHHLAIGNNLPFFRIAEFMASICLNAIVEFVPKEDPQTQTLLTFREDCFEDYTPAMFEKEFAAFFDIKETCPLGDSMRTLYLFQRKGGAP